MKNQIITGLAILLSTLLFTSSVAANTRLKPKARITCNAPQSVLDHALELWTEEMRKTQPGKGLTFEAKGCDLQEITCTPQGDSQNILVAQICSVLYDDQGKPRHLQPTGQNRVISAKIRMTADGILSVIK